MRYIEKDLPIEGLNAITEKEGNAKKTSLHQGTSY